MKSKHWIALFLGAVGIPLALCAGVIYQVDPCFMFRLPESGQAVFFEQRQQNAGLIRQIQADTIVLGTSMASSYRPSQISQVYGGSGLKLSFPDGYMSEFDLAMEAIEAYQDPERIIFLFDPNILIRDETEKTDAMPSYLYDGDPLVLAKYLLNKDIFYRSIYASGFADETLYQPLDEGFTMDAYLNWSKAKALSCYERPDLAETHTDYTDTFVANAKENVAVVLQWAQRFPDWEFVIAFPPYSILQWDAYQREGKTQAVFVAIETAMNLLLEQDNISVHFLTGDIDTITDLSQYGDHVHHSSLVAGEMLEALNQGDFQVSWANKSQIMDEFQTFVTQYDYDSIWE